MGSIYKNKIHLETTKSYEYTDSWLLGGMLLVLLQNTAHQSVNDQGLAKELQSEIYVGVHAPISGRHQDILQDEF